MDLLRIASRVAQISDSELSSESAWHATVIVPEGKTLDESLEKIRSRSKFKLGDYELVQAEGKFQSILIEVPDPKFQNYMKARGSYTVRVPNGKNPYVLEIEEP